MAGTLNHDEDEIVSGINITPLVDVVLVLLVIFIVTASTLLRTSIPMELPKAATAEESTAGLLVVGVGEDGGLYLNGRRGTVEDIPAAVAEARAKATQPEDRLSVFVSADVAAPYGRFAEVVDRLRLAGVTDVAMDTSPIAAEEKL